MGSRFLDTLGGDDRAALIAAGRSASAGPGDHLMWEGDPADHVLVLLRGHVKLTKLAGSGRESLIDLRGAGDLVGELGVIDGQPRSASVTALAPVEMVTLTAERFRSFLRARPRVSDAVVALVVQRLRIATARQLELHTVDGTARVCGRLAELALTHGDSVDGGVLIRDAVSQQELADWAGMSRDGVVRALQDLRAEGLVSTGRREIFVHDLAELRARAGM